MRDRLLRELASAWRAAFGEKIFLAPEVFLDVDVEAKTFMVPKQAFFSFCEVLEGDRFIIRPYKVAHGLTYQSQSLQVLSGGTEVPTAFRHPAIQAGSISLISLDHVPLGDMTKVKLGKWVASLIRSLRSMDWESVPGAARPHTEEQIPAFRERLNEIDISPENLRRYVTDVFSRIGGGKLRIVSGSEIAHYYSEDQYRCGSPSDSELGRSCMRGEECQDWFEVYTENPEVCRLAILVNDEDQISARALLWKGWCRGKKVWAIDRIYFWRDTDKASLTSQLLASDEIEVAHSIAHYNDDTGWGSHYTGEFTVDVGYMPSRDDGWPYMDTMCYVDADKGQLSNQVGTYSTSFIAQQTDGNIELPQVETPSGTYDQEDCIEVDLFPPTVNEAWVHQSEVGFTDSGESAWEGHIVFTPDGEGHYYEHCAITIDGTHRLLEDCRVTPGGKVIAFEEGMDESLETPSETNIYIQY